MSFLGEIKRRKIFQVAAVYAVVARQKRCGGCKYWRVAPAHTRTLLCWRMLRETN